MLQSNSGSINKRFKIVSNFWVTGQVWVEIFEPGNPVTTQIAALEGTEVQDRDEHRGVCLCLEECNQEGCLAILSKVVESQHSDSKVNLFMLKSKNIASQYRTLLIKIT